VQLRLRHKSKKNQDLMGFFMKKSQ